MQLVVKETQEKEYNTTPKHTWQITTSMPRPQPRHRHGSTTTTPPSSSRGSGRRRLRNTTTSTSTSSPRNNNGNGVRVEVKLPSTRFGFLWVIVTSFVSAFLLLQFHRDQQHSLQASSVATSNLVALLPPPSQQWRYWADMSSTEDPTSQGPSLLHPNSNSNSHSTPTPIRPPPQTPMQIQSIAMPCLYKWARICICWRTC